MKAKDICEWCGNECKNKHDYFNGMPACSISCYHELQEQLYWEIELLDPYPKSDNDDSNEDNLPF